VALRRPRRWVLALGLAGLGALAALGLRLAARPPAEGHPFAQAREVGGGGERFSARVLERIDAGSYVYLRVAREAGEPLWVVTLEAVAPDAERVDVHVVRRSESFESPRLKRRFAPLGFAIVRKESS